MKTAETRALEALATAIVLMQQGSLCDARDVIRNIELPDGSPARIVMERMEEFIACLSDELSSKELALATVQTAMWELESERSMRVQAEFELRQAQKLEAVGQLAAGIAHEINTPAQFVCDNIHFLANSFKDSLHLMAKYRLVIEELSAAPGYETFGRQAKEAEAAVDLDFIEDNVPAAFNQSLEGISRISSIVRALKEFAHPDQREKSQADLNRALQATLIIAKNEYKYVADVETEFGELPPVICHLGGINQVFLNLLINAAHAITDVVGNSGDKGLIRVRTMLEGNNVRIDISDTGCGIPEKVRGRVFDPFFTTKEVGRGSGQGLAIARSIVVEKHGGSLVFESEVEKGTTFIIRLPVD